MQDMVLRGFVSFHRIGEAGSLLSLGLSYARMSRNYCVEVKDLELKVPVASGSRASVQHRPHQRAPSPSDFTLSRESSSSDIPLFIRHPSFTSCQYSSVSSRSYHMSSLIRYDRWGSSSAAQQLAISDAYILAHYLLSTIQLLACCFAHVSVDVKGFRGSNDLFCAVHFQSLACRKT